MFNENRPCGALLTLLAPLRRPAQRDLFNLGYSWLPSQFMLALDSFPVFLAAMFGSCEEMSASVSEAFGSARRWNA